MKLILEIILIVPLFVLLYQFYSYAVRSTGIVKQRKCQLLGIIYTTIGIICLVFHSLVSVIGGLLLIMLGFRLFEQGLE